MTAITFPTSPTLGQEFVAVNGATYIWLGNRWSSARAVQTGTAEHIIEGGDSAWAYNDLTDNTVDGGTSTI